MRTILKGAGSNIIVEEHNEKKPARQKEKCQTVCFDNPPYVVGRAAVVGEKEGKGPIGKYFHVVKSDDKTAKKRLKKPKSTCCSKP